MFRIDSKFYIGTSPQCSLFSLMHIWNHLSWLWPLKTFQNQLSNVYEKLYYVFVYLCFQDIISKVIYVISGIRSIAFDYNTESDKVFLENQHIKWPPIVWDVIGTNNNNNIEMQENRMWMEVIEHTNGYYEYFVDVQVSECRMWSTWRSIFSGSNL